MTPYENQMSLRAHIEVCDETRISGWAVSVDDPQAKLRLAVLHRGTRIGECVADRFRPDLKEAGIGDGACAFEFVLPLFLPKSELNHLSVLCGSTDLLAKAPAPSATTSRFGGLWIDRPDYLETLERKRSRGE